MYFQTVGQTGDGSQVSGTRSLVVKQLTINRAQARAPLQTTDNRQLTTMGVGCSP